MTEAGPARRRHLQAWVLLASVVGGALAVYLLGQDANWDLRNYHFYDGYAVWAGRLAVDIAPAQLQTYFNPTLDALVYLAFANLDPRLSGALLGAIHGLNLWLVFVIARAVLSDFGGRTPAWLALVCVVVAASGSAFRAEIGTVFHDLVGSLFVLGALALFLHANRVVGATRWSGRAAAAGLLFGIGLGLKYTLIFYLPGFVLALAVTPGVASRRWAIGNWLAGATIGFVLVAGWWLRVLGREFGNPIFPLYNTIFQSPFARLDNFGDHRFLPTSWAQALFYPLHFAREPLAVSELAFRDWRFAAIQLLVMVGAAVLAWHVLAGRRVAWPPTGRGPVAGPSARLFLVVFVLVSYVAWQWQFSIYRYAAALELVAPVIAVVLATWIWGQRRRSLAVVLGIFVVLLATTRPAVWGRVPWSGAFLEMEVPALPRPDRTVVLMTTFAPMSFVIAGFPPAVRFVRLESNFHHVEDQTRMGEQIRGLLRASDRDFYLLAPAGTLDAAADLLQPYGLRVESADAQPVPTNLDRSLVLTPVVRVTPAADDP